MAAWPPTLSSEVSTSALSSSNKEQRPLTFALTQACGGVQSYGGSAGRLIRGTPGPLSAAPPTESSVAVGLSVPSEAGPGVRCPTLGWVGLSGSTRSPKRTARDALRWHTLENESTVTY
jgi:hypothetical protein